MKRICTYGTLRLGEGNWAWCLNNDESVHLGTTTVDDKFTLVDYAHGGFPAVVRHEDGNTPIVVDIFEVSDKVAANVDRLEGYDESEAEHRFYDRMEVDTEFGKALIYFMDESALNRPKIESGDWIKYLKNQYEEV